MASTTRSDPVCGMQVDPETAVAVQHGGRVYYFCESACAETFRTGPHPHWDLRPFSSGTYRARGNSYQTSHGLRST